MSNQNLKWFHLQTCISLNKHMQILIEKHYKMTKTAYAYGNFLLYVYCMQLQEIRV